MQNTFQKIIFPVLVVLLLVTLGTTYYYYGVAKQLKDNPQKVAQDEVKAVVEMIGKLMYLPAGEQPTLATVADPSKLKDQPFFARAKVGDKVLLYTNARKAILYDPVANKIVEVAPITIGVQPTPAAPAPAAPEAKK